MANIIEYITDTFDKASLRSRNASLAQAIAAFDLRYVDLRIQFIGASGLPKMDVVGSADPYFIAQLDGEITFVSTVQTDTLAPVWNEWWFVRNVPSSAALRVRVMDRDDGMADDYIGRFTTSIAPGAKEAEIEGPVLKRTRGTMWLKIDSTPAADAAPHAHPYLFDGPVRFTRHFSSAVGYLTGADARRYSTWELALRGVPLHFGARLQPWNRSYSAAQRIFHGPAAPAVRAGIHAAHAMLYARSTADGAGTIGARADVLRVLSGPAAHAHRVKPAEYTYVLCAGGALRFSETGAAFFADAASKHALHSDCAAAVRYAGEFHPRPAGGWAALAGAGAGGADVRWELVVDNNSGTYAPDAALLPALQALLEDNFPGVAVLALDREDPALVESREACRAYAVRYRGVQQDEVT